MNGSGGRI